MTVHSLIVADNEDRPYEKCMRYGPSSLTDAQLLAVIIRTGTQGVSAEQLSERVLGLSAGEKGLLGLCHVSAEELQGIPGVGKVKAVQLLCIGELSRRIATYRARTGLSFDDPESIAAYYMEQLRHEEREHLICMMLDTRNHLIAEKRISTGTVNASLVSTRDLFLEALRVHAVNLILVHNHPSGDPAPSEEDRRITKKVMQAGAILDVTPLDHIIIGDRSYYSFRENGMLEET